MQSQYKNAHPGKLSENLKNPVSLNYLEFHVIMGVKEKSVLQERKIERDESA
jgi:hypothetical protein